MPDRSDDVAQWCASDDDTPALLPNARARAPRILGMTDCIHGFATHECGDCAASATGPARRRIGDMAGKRFALVFAPAYDAGSFIHLNVEGEHWKLRAYPSPHAPAVVLAQSAPSSNSVIKDLRAVERLREIHFPHSSTAEGVGVRDARY